jgi:triosephosphate isomerase
VRRKFIAGNWKMHKTSGEAAALAGAIAKALAGVRDRRVMVAPPFTALPAVRAALAGSAIALGAQTAAAEAEGAHTGEISPRMLKDCGVSVVILGHSERRRLYGETDALVNRKVRLALDSGLEVILCVGETLEERQAGATEAVVERQLSGGLAGVEAGPLARVTIAYEPVWAIGTGRNATPSDAHAVHRFIRTVLARRYTAAASEAMTIQYGGSVKPDNARELLSMPGIDGALVGGASLALETFLPIVQFDR